MNYRLSPKLSLPRGFFAIALAAGLCCVVPTRASPTDSKSDQPKQTADKTRKKPKKAPTGAELYAIHCNRCHPERYAPERTDTQWKTILTHMRVRANLPAEQARAIMKFLQEESGK